jgi:DNA-binding response OmpR family regulator
MKVLLVDDDRFQADSIRRGLHLMGHRTVSIGVGQAFEVLTSASPGTWDLVVLDLGVPGAQFAVAADLRRQAPDLPILAIAGLATSPELEAARRLGVPVLRKPFDATALDRAIRAAAEHHVSPKTGRRNP